MWFADIGRTSCCLKLLPMPLADFAGNAPTPVLRAGDVRHGRFDGAWSAAGVNSNRLAATPNSAQPPSVTGNVGLTRATASAESVYCFQVRARLCLRRHQSILLPAVQPAERCTG
jgi:hypothetical protein